jgi:Family of unknown function (DUF6519)
MRGDFSRLSWHPGNGYRRVMLQQGRVLLDADFNGQGELSARALRILTRDLLGPHAGPADELGFGIEADGDTFAITRGRYYVDGLLAVNAPNEANPIAPLGYADQEAFPFPGSVAQFTEGKPYFFFLDVWERGVSWLEDASIRDAALGGPDTALRGELVWQVRAIARPTATAPELDDADKAGKWLSENVKRHPVTSPLPGLRLPRMTASVDPKDNPDDTPCVADPLGGYTGLENQLYRVEIHAAPDVDDQPASDLLTFKWSRDNGSVVAALVRHTDHDLIVEGVHDIAHGFSAGQWVEVADRRSELRGEHGVMVRLLKVDQGVLTYDPASASDSIPSVDQMLYPVVRRWDHRRRDGQPLEGGAVVLHEDQDYVLESGITVRFPKQDAAVTGKRRYAVGDYWTFPARTATTDIEWPFTLQSVDGQVDKLKVYLDRDPDGIEHVFAPLAVVTTVGSSVGPKSLQRAIKTLWDPV